MKPISSTLINQKVTITDEKYAFLDKSTVIYTTNCKFLENYKDGYAILSDPMVMQFTFRKINDKWMAINGVESSVRQNAKNTEMSKGLNQVELMKQFIGNWKSEFAKDTNAITEITSFGNGGALENYWNVSAKGKIYYEGRYLWGYDKKSDKYILTQISKKSPNIYLNVFWFTSKNTCEGMSFEYISNPEQVTSKTIYEFKSPDLLIGTEIKNNKPIKTNTWTRLKK
jgi:hypothetical protein